MIYAWGGGGGESVNFGGFRTEVAERKGQERGRDAVLCREMEGSRWILVRSVGRRHMPKYLR